MGAPGRRRGRCLLPVLALLGVTLVTLSERSGNGGIFAKPRSYDADKRGKLPAGVALSQR